MRTYLGDELFFQGLQALQTDFAQSAIDAIDVRNKLTQTTGVDMKSFFDDWIFQPGFVGVVLDSFQVVPNGNQFDVKVSMRQKIRKANHLFSSFPLRVSFVQDIGTEVHETITFSGEQMTANFTLPFNPKMVYLNGNEGIMNAVTAKNYLLTESGTFLDNYSYSRVIAPAANPPGTRLVRIEHCRVAPDAFDENNPGVKISSERYWRVDGVWDKDFTWNTWFVFDARNNASGNLDMDLMQNPHQINFHEDSLKLLYRPNPSSPWTIVEHAELNRLGSATDGYARFVLNNVQKGEYTFGFKFSSLNLGDYKLNNFVIYPNPAQGFFSFKAPNSNEKYTLLIHDNAGRLLKSIHVSNGQIIELDKNWHGVLHVSVCINNKILGTQRLVVD
jgi:hypothetical protein